MGKEMANLIYKNVNVPGRELKRNSFPPSHSRTPCFISRCRSWGRCKLSRGKNNCTPRTNRLAPTHLQPPRQISTNEHAHTHFALLSHIRFKGDNLQRYWRGAVTIKHDVRPRTGWRHRPSVDCLVDVMNGVWFFCTPEDMHWYHGNQKQDFNISQFLISII